MSPATPAPIFSVEMSTRDDGSAIAKVNGEIDAATADQLQNDLLEAISATSSSAASSVAVDLASVNFMDSSGLRAMIIAMNAAEEAGVSLRIVATTPAVDRLLEITGLTERLT